MELKATQPLELSPVPFKPLNGDIIYSQEFSDLTFIIILHVFQREENITPT